MEKAINKLLIVFAALAAAFGAGAYLFRNVPHGTAYEEKIELSLCEYIDIDVLRLDVEVQPYEGEKILVRYTNDVPLNFSVGDNSLTINESDEFVITLFAQDSARFGMSVYLPREIYRAITIYSGSGDVKLGALDAQRIDVTTGSGNITSEDTRSLVYFSSGTGDISLDFAAVIPESAIVTRSGNAFLTIPSESSVALDFETETGECQSELFAGRAIGSYMYSINGGQELIHATLEKGTLTVSEKG